MEAHPETAHLRYLDANQVRLPSGTLAGMPVCTADRTTLGAIDGVLIEPATRRLRFFVVAAPARLRKRRFLLPADAPAIVDDADARLVVDAGVEDLERFDARSVARFSDDDAITAIFARSAA